MINTKSPTDSSSLSALFPMETPAQKRQHYAPALPSLSPLLHRTRYLLSTPNGWIADQSKKRANYRSPYTEQLGQALSFVSFDAATERARTIYKFEPQIKVTHIEVVCTPRSYPLGWTGADD